MLSRLFKLMKFELKCTFRSFGILYLVILAASFFLIPSGESTTFGVIISIVYGVSIGVLFVMNFVTIIKNFYSSMFQKTSYLTQTLPVKSYELVAAKLFISYLWLMVSVIVLIVSTFIIAFQANNASFYEIMDVLKVLLEATLKSQFWFIVLYLIIAPMESILIMYFIMTAVHTKYVRKYHAFACIVLFFLITFVISKINLGFNSMAFSASYSSSNIMMNSEVLPFYYSDAEAWLSLGISFIIGVAFFAATCYILDRKLEIE